jgi:hypothetical protein
VLDDGGVGGIGVALSNRVRKVSSESVGLDDGGVEGWGSGQVGGSCWGVGNWGNDSGRSDGNEGQQSDDGLL